MVNSKLNPVINYVENKGLDPEDMEFDAQPWEVTMLDEDITIALGNPKYQHVKKNVIYYPIYLIKNNKVDTQIGVYEIISDQLASLLDEDGDLDIDSLEPLLFSFVNKGLLYTETGHDIAVDDDEDDDEDDEDDDILEPDENDDDEDDEDGLDVVGSIDEDKSKTIVIDKSVIPMPELSSQTKADAMKERERVTGNRPWVAKFMGNQNYEIQEVGGGGDCLFHVVRHALGTVGKRTSVSKLRSLLSKEATQPVFDSYKAIFDSIKPSIAENKKIKKALVAENKKLKDLLKNTNDRAKQIEIVDRAKELKNEYSRIKKEDQASTSMYNEYKFMEGVTNLQAFKDVIKTCKFWAETWSISTLERSLNIKLILLSKQHYAHGDMANVLQCGQLNDEILQQQGIFEPDHYIIANYTGQHYQCVQYKGRSIFTFKEIPYDLKLKICDRCMEGNDQAGPYQIIPDFKDFCNEIGGKSIDDDDDDVDDDSSPSKSPEEDNMQGELFDDNIVFQFYSRSSDVPPGKGSGEKIPRDKMDEFKNLAQIDNWRKMLSNFAIASFECDGKEWLTVEHFYQASKFKNTNSENGFYDQFSLDSQSEISKSPGMAKCAGGKTGKCKGKQVRSKNIVMDVDFMGNRRDETMEKAMYCKFTQNPEFKTMLLATNNAKLVHFVRASPVDVFYDLMKVRKRIREES